MSNISIRACPFCGGHGCLYSNYSARHRQFFVYVKCEICGAQSKSFAVREAPEDHGWNTAECDNAIMAWNMRKEGAANGQ